MTRNDGRDPVAMLSTVLERERAALLAGDITALSGLAEEKSAALALLSTCPPAHPGPALEALQRRAEANQALITAAGEGLRAVRDRLMNLRNGGPPLSTYDSMGAAHEHGPPKSSLERRA